MRQNGSPIFASRSRLASCASSVIFQKGNIRYKIGTKKPRMSRGFFIQKRGRCFGFVQLRGCCRYMFLASWWR